MHDFVERNFGKMKVVKSSLFGGKLVNLLSRDIKKGVKSSLFIYGGFFTAF